MSALTTSSQCNQVLKDPVPVQEHTFGLKQIPHLRSKGAEVKTHRGNLARSFKWEQSPCPLCSGVKFHLNIYHHSGINVSCLFVF